MQRSQTKYLRHFATLVATALVAAALVGCGGDTETGERNSSNRGEPDAGSRDAMQTDAYDDSGTPDSGETPTSTLSLTVFDIEGKRVDAASVEIAGTEKSTDSSGTVRFSGLEPGRTVAKIGADGFAPSTVVVDLTEETTTHRAAHLLRASDAKTFDATTPSDLYEDRVHVYLPEDALVDSEGNPYTGTAALKITPLNPSTSERDAMPGPLMGVLEGDDEPTPMESLFMADIRIESDSGEPLSLADGKEATLEFVLPDDLQDSYSKGDEVEAYYYDTDAGLWKQDGFGEVVGSSYANGKLAWQADVRHFTWWNGDVPYTDKNCAKIEVVRSSNGQPVAGAQVYVNGRSYNGKTFATTGKNGTTCANFKRGAKAEITVDGPKGLWAKNFGKHISGSSTAATCSGQGSGSCQQVTVQLVEPTCVSGKVVDSSGNPISGAEVVGSYRGANGRHSVRATTGSSGEYCLSVPPDHQVEVTARHKVNGTFKSDSATVRANSNSKSCGSGSCKTVPNLTPKKGQTGCLTSTAQVDAPSGMRAASPGTHVYAFAGTSDSSDPVNVDCSKKPEKWGTLIAETTTGAGGDFCLKVPKNAPNLTVVVGKCNNGQECTNYRPAPGQISNSASCGSGNCFYMERFGLPLCADGP